MFFGFETDTVLASYLFAVIDQAIRSELDGFPSRRPELAGTRLRQASSNFQIGTAARVAERLTAMHVEREASVAAQRPTGTALVLLRHRVVEDAFRVTAPNVRLHVIPRIAGLIRFAAFNLRLETPSVSQLLQL